MMTHCNEILRDEVQLAEDECCAVFDFSCLFPYSNPEILTFNFSLGEERFDDYKMNHRYPNKFYQTISRRYGRKVSKLGYPYVMKLEECNQGPILLCVNVGIKEQYLTLIFPLLLTMTKERPLCNLSFKYNFDKNQFYFESSKKTEDGSYLSLIWKSHEESDGCFGDITVLNAPERIGGDDSSTLVYEDIIEPRPVALDHLSSLFV